MNVLIAPDKFKGSLPALAVCEAIQQGLHDAYPALTCVPFPLADGGDGTASILTHHAGGHEVQATVLNPLGQQVTATYGYAPQQRTAFIEMAAASGLHLLQPHQRQGLATHTSGTGQLLLHAIQQGATTILLGIGGSATNDCGMGMASALGYQFFDAHNNPVAPSGQNLGKVHRIDSSQVSINTTEITIRVACDVNNPLTGPEGAAYTYGPQKGVQPNELATLDAGMHHFGQVLAQHFGQDYSQLPGAGAAGGLGAGAMAFLRATLQPGIDMVMQQTGFEAALGKADVVITGEGRIDDQTLHGKVIQGVCKQAAAQGVPVLALCGALEASQATIKQLGLSYAASILTMPTTLKEAMQPQATQHNLRQAAFNAIRLLKAGC